ncbi:hypothetical protein FM113_04085 [Leucobacter sp. 7(1)]|nr:hypothetical protein FM113_04085 [Leucobacter sp. 7(1)]
MTITLALVSGHRFLILAEPPDQAYGSLTSWELRTGCTPSIVHQDTR